ncbi:MAG: P-type conjugative transfer protein TrbG [Azospirillum sp.]|nr:P-type conjugative transfer protein TrbG [Azospirillum sp.]
MIRIRPIRSTLLLSVSVLALAACASRTPAPQLARYDAATPNPAVRIAEPPPPVRIVQVPTPVPLPGQLQPAPGPTAADTRPPTARVDAANSEALQEPTAHGYINAVQVYPFMESALYRLYAAPEQVTDIGLQAGENLTAVSAGDTVRWIIGDTTSGSSEGKRAHVLVKPSAPGLKTNLIIATDRRTYHLRMESTEQTAMAAISWTYPQDQIIALQRQNAEAEAATPVAEGLSLDHLRFSYAITGDRPPWRPMRAFDDGSKVFIEFPGRIDQGEMPPLFVLGAAGDSQLVNYRVRGNYYIVDRLFGSAELRLGTDPQQTVRIIRTDAVAASGGGL